VLRDLSHSSLEDVCIAWRRGLRRVWDLSSGTHSALIAALCGLLQLKDELACRCAGFITKCLCSANQTVRPIANLLHMEYTVSECGLLSVECSILCCFVLGLYLQCCSRYQKDGLDKSWGTAVRHWLWSSKQFQNCLCSTRVVCWSIFCDKTQPDPSSDWPNPTHIKQQQAYGLAVKPFIQHTYTQHHIKHQLNK